MRREAREAPRSESAGSVVAPAAVPETEVLSLEILERITDGFLALDRQARVTYLNRSAEQILGRTRREIIGRSIWEVFPEAAETRAFRTFQRAVAEQVTVQLEEFLPSLGRCFRARLFPGTDGLSVYFRDITEERRTEEALRASEIQFRELAEHIREVLYLTTPDAEEILYVSPAFDEIWGISRECLLNDPGAWTRVIDPRDRERVLAAIPRMKEGTYEEQYRIIHPGGRTRWILDRTFPVRNERGEVYRIVGIAEDITVEKEAANERERLLSREQQARREAERATKLREEVLAIVSHDLKNPLHSIRISAGALRDLPLTEEKRTEVLDRILSATERMERMVQGFLDTARLEAGQGLPLDLRPVETATLLCGACALFLPQIEDKRIRLHCEPPPDSPPVYADFNRILQVFWNLIGNAVKFTPVCGHVIVGAERQGSLCRFSVTDSGPGIPPDHLERLFDPYWQEKRTARLGTGLGLPISRAIVEAHGGSIRVESIVGQGTTFFFVLPIAPSGRTD